MRKIVRLLRNFKLCPCLSLSVSTTQQCLLQMSNHYSVCHGCESSYSRCHITHFCINVIIQSEIYLFKPKDVVEIQNLRKAAHLNGKLAIVVGHFLFDSQRWPIQLIEDEDKKLQIKSNNIKLKTRYNIILQSNLIQKVIYRVNKKLKLLNLSKLLLDDGNIKKVFEHYNFDKEWLLTIDREIFISTFIQHIKNAELQTMDMLYRELIENIKFTYKKNDDV